MRFSTIYFIIGFKLAKESKLKVLKLLPLALCPLQWAHNLLLMKFLHIYMRYTKSRNIICCTTNLNNYCNIKTKL